MNCAALGSVGGRACANGCKFLAARCLSHPVRRAAGCRAGCGIVDAVSEGAAHSVCDAGLRGISARVRSNVQHYIAGWDDDAHPGSSLPVRLVCDANGGASSWELITRTRWLPLTRPESAPQSNGAQSNDFLFTARPALTGSAIGVSFQSNNYPAMYIAISSTSTTEQGSLRLGLLDPAAALDNATWLVVPGLAGGFNTYSLRVSSRRSLVVARKRRIASPAAQSMSRTRGVAGLYATLLSGTLSGSCSNRFNSPAGDVAVTSGDSASGATWVFYPPLPFVTCSQVRD